MAFVVRHRKLARQELDDCASRLGSDFVRSVELWLQKLADEAEVGEYTISTDADEFFKKLDSGIRTLHQKIRHAGWREKFLAFVARWTGRKPPREFRAAMHVFLVPNLISGRPPMSPGVVVVLYEVDRIARQIVVTKYADLPIQS